MLGQLKVANRLPSAAWMLIGFAVLFLPLFFSFLTGNEIFASGDSMGFVYPSLRAIKPFSLSSILADPYSGRGFPWLVTYGTLDPLTHILRFFFNEFQTHAWINYLSFVFGGWFLSLFLLRRGHTALSSFIGGAVGPCMFWIGYGDFSAAYTMPLFTASLLVLQKGEQHPYRNTILLAAIVSWLWWTVHFHYTTLSLIGATAYALSTVWNNWETDRKRARTMLAIWFIGMSVGTIVGLFKVIPAFAYLQFSERAGGFSFADATVDSLSPSAVYAPLFPLLNFPFIPLVSGGVIYGAGALVLLIGGIVLARTKEKAALLGWSACLLLALPRSPFYWILFHFPLMSFLHGPARILFVGNAAGAVLVATGMDALLRGELQNVRKRMGKFLLVVGITATLISLSLTIINVMWSDPLLKRAREYFDANFYAKTSQLPHEHYYNYIEGLWNQIVDAFSLVSLPFLIPLLLIFATAIIVLRSDWWQTRKAPLALAVTALVGMCWPYYFYHARIPLEPITTAREEFAKSPIGDTYVLSVLSALSSYLLNVDVPDLTQLENSRKELMLLIPNRQALLGVHSIDFYQPLMPLRMGRLLAALGSDIAIAPRDERLSLAKLPVEEKLRTVLSRKELMSVLNIHYLVSAMELPAPFKHVYTFKPVERLPEIRVYEVPNPRPIAYIAQKIDQFPPDEDRAMMILRDLQDAQLSTIECASCPVIPTSTDQPTITLKEDTSLSLAADVKTSRPMWLVISKPRFPGWRAIVDGKPVKTAIANGYFFGIPLETGTHDVRVEITYQSILTDSIKFLLYKRDPWLL